MNYKKNNHETHFNIKETFIKDVSNAKFLNQREEIETIIKAKNGDKKAIDALVVGTIKYVSKIAHSYVHKHLNSSDLMQEGVFGVLDAIKHFDANKNIRFLSYANYWIKNAMNRACIDRGYEIRVPNGQYQLYTKFKKALKNSELSLNKLIYSSEFYEDRNDIISIMNIYNFKTDRTFDDGSDNDSIIENVPYYETQSDEIACTKNNKIIEKILNKLNKNEKKVISLYYGINEKENFTLEQIGKKLGFTKERIRQIKNIAEQKMKLYFRDMKIDYSDF